MSGLVFAVLFGLIFLLFSCKGQISLPPGGDTFIVLPGENVTIAWKLDVYVSDLSFRTWKFVPNGKIFAQIILDMDVTPFPQNLPGPFTIKKPSTLTLKNVNIQYNGTYRFSVTAIGIVTSSDVTVFVAVKPNVTFSCSSPFIVGEGDNVTCVCRGEGGNHPANVTWFKDGVQIGETGKEEQKLTISNVSRAENGTYNCVAQSHTNSMFVDEKSIEIEVRRKYKPKNTTITFTPEKAIFGRTVDVRCKSDGFPEPSYTITHNGTDVNNETKHTIVDVKWDDAGTYKCIARNELGRDSDSGNLTVKEHGPTTTQSATPTTQPATPTSKTSNKTTTVKTGNNGTANTAANKEDDGTTVVVWHIMVSLVSGIIIGILLSYIVWCSHRRWFRPRKFERNTEPQTTEIDTTYQELDLTKMNKEDNYQSLRVNAASNDAASNDDDSTYTDLNKTRDVENNYQSLT